MDTDNSAMSSKAIFLFLQALNVGLLYIQFCECLVEGNVVASAALTQNKLSNMVHQRLYHSNHMVRSGLECFFMKKENKDINQQIPLVRRTHAGTKASPRLPSSGSYLEPLQQPLTELWKEVVDYRPISLYFKDAKRMLPTALFPFHNMVVKLVLK